MNRFKKYCPNVWIAECEEKYEKGDLITLYTKYNKEVECLVHNFLGYAGTKEEPKHLYSIERTEEQTYAQRKAEKYTNASLKSANKSKEEFDKSNEGRDFLSLGEPIKVGHHSEKRHRALIERNWRRVEKGLEYDEKAKEQQRKAEYWEMKAEEITLANPESIDFFKVKLEQAQQYHEGVKNGTIKREHSYSLTYAKKHVNEMKKKYDIAIKLWK